MPSNRTQRARAPVTPYLKPETQAGRVPKPDPCDVPNLDRNVPTPEADDAPKLKIKIKIKPRPKPFVVPPVTAYRTIEKLKEVYRELWEESKLNGRKIPRSPNYYIVGRAEWSRTLGGQQGAISKGLKSAWESLDENGEVMLYFKRAADEMAVLHKEIFPEYKYQPVRKSAKKQKRATQSKEQEGLRPPSLASCSQCAAVMQATENTGLYQQDNVLPVPFNNAREANVMVPGHVFGMQHDGVPNGLLDFSGSIMRQASVGWEPPYGNFGVGAAHSQFLQLPPQNTTDGTMGWNHNSGPISQLLTHDNFNDALAEDFGFYPSQVDFPAFVWQQAPEWQAA